MQLLLRAAAADACEELTCHSFLMRFTLTGGEGFGSVRIKEKSEKGEPVRKIKKQEEEDPTSSSSSSLFGPSHRLTAHTPHLLSGLTLFTWTCCLSAVEAVQVRAHRNPLSNSFLCFV